MKRWVFAVGCLLVLFAGPVSSADIAVEVIPEPVEVQVRPGVFHFTAETRIAATGPARLEAGRLIEYLSVPMGWLLQSVDRPQVDKDHVIMQLTPALTESLGQEGYRLDVNPGQIRIQAADSAGLFYAVQTLRQLLPEDVFSRHRVDNVAWNVPCVKIVDYPRFAWRGLLIDPARHFIPIEDVKRFIDVMAVHKLNRLQMHLTDNEGWRIEIRKYPELTALGSKMDWTCLRKGTAQPQCPGFYTQSQIRELVRYASERHITIVPEIEMPYHTGAAIVAYPELGINSAVLTELPPGNRWGRTHGLIAPRPATVRFLQDVLRK